MPIAWVDVPDPKNPPTGAPKLNAANLARHALVEDIGVTGTPTGDAGRAAFDTRLTVAATASASGALVADAHTPVDATTAARTMTLPTGQPAGSRIVVEKVDASTNTVTLSGNIRGVAAQTVALAWQRETLLLVADAAGSWWPAAGHKTKTSLDAAYVQPTELSYPVTSSSPSPSRQGAAGNYTGRLSTAGAGTDSRAGIQAALNAASNRNDASYYGYLTTNGITVKLPAGVYYISNPNTGAPSLTVPERVTFDTSDAILFFDPPATATTTWCGVQVGQYANMIVGRLYKTPGTSFPDTQDVYDAIRVWQTDLTSRIRGGKDSEINGWQGACIRGVGSWITYLDGIRLMGSSYGYIASNYYAAADGGVLGGALSAPTGFTNRVHSDLRVDNCAFVNLSKGAILGAVQGKSGNINAPDYAASNFSLGLRGCVFESIGTAALQLYNLLDLMSWDCAWEEVGGVSSPMNIFDTVRVANMTGVRINLGGRTVNGPSGSVVPFPSAFVQNTSVQHFQIESLYMHNTYTTHVQIASTAPSSYRYSGIYVDANDFQAGAGYAGKALTLAGTWNGNHLVLNGAHLWVDATGALRKSATAPASDTGGTVVAT